MFQPIGHTTLPPKYFLFHGLVARGLEDVNRSLPANIPIAKELLILPYKLAITIMYKYVFCKKRPYMIVKT